MNNTYLLIQTKLNGFNANSGFYTIGLPALTAFAGSFHNLQRKINDLFKKNDIKNTLKINGFSIASKNIFIREGHAKYINATKSSDPSKNASSIDQKLGDGDFVFILKLEKNITENDLMDLGFSGENAFLNLFHELLMNFKVAGGNLQGPYIKNAESFIEINNKIKYKNYYYLVDEASLLKDKNFEELINLIARPIQTENEFIYKPFYIPIVTGYALLEEPKIKKQIISRNKLFKHAYVEPIISLCRLQKITSILFEIRNAEESVNSIEKLFWNYAVKDNLYYVKTQSNTKENVNE